MPCFSWFCNKIHWTQDIFYTSSPYHASVKPMGHLNVHRWQIKKLINLPQTAYWGCFPYLSRPMKQSQSFQGLWSSPRHFKDYVWSCMKSFHSLAVAFLSFIVLCYFFDKEINALCFRYGDRKHLWESVSQTDCALLWECVDMCGGTVQDTTHFPYSQDRKWGRKQPGKAW